MAGALFVFPFLTSPSVSPSLFLPPSPHHPTPRVPPQHWTCCRCWGVLEGRSTTRLGRACW